MLIDMSGSMIQQSEKLQIHYNDNSVINFGSYSLHQMPPTFVAIDEATFL